MDFSVFARPVIVGLKFIRAFTRRTSAERKALKTPEQEKHSLYSVMEKTLVHLGVQSSGLLSVKERWVLSLERAMVISEPFTYPHVQKWLNNAYVQEKLKCMAVQGLTHERPDHSIEIELIEHYVTTTGDAQAVAMDIVNKATATIITGTLKGLQDPELGILLKIHSHALHEKLDKLGHRLNPEQQISLLEQCLQNARWLTGTFSNKSNAKIRLGQALCPGDKGPNPVLERQTLQRQISHTLSALPEGGVLVVTGTEGNGKSWIVGQHWLSLSVKPLTVFLRAEEIDESFNDISNIIIKGLCRSNKTNTENLDKFWQWQFGLWEDKCKRPVSGMIVILDGINQRPSIRWALFIDRLSEFLKAVGGKLIITSRHHYFTQAVETRLVSPFKLCSVPEWSSDERDQILCLRNINIRGRQLSERVALGLCNPRMLGIALELFNAEQLYDLTELSTSLMLFEHIRVSHRDSYEQSAALFSDHLRGYGQKILSRVSKGDDDIDVFKSDIDTIFDGELYAVADGRFFIPLPEDSTRYRIHPEGLSLALGFAILDIVNEAGRNNKDLDNAIASVVEPVIALDKTSDTLFAALTVACLDKKQPVGSGVAILTGFVGLQNPDIQLAPAFVSLVRHRPEVFYKTCEHLSLVNKNLLGHTWIEAALVQSVQYPKVSEMILAAAADWLGWVPSRIPLSSISSSKDEGHIEEEIEKLLKKREAKIAHFSPWERAIFDTLTFKDTDSLSALYLLAFKILSGAALMPRINELVKWSFAYDLTLDYSAPWAVFRDLITFNNIDWEEVRLYLQKQWELAIHEESSKTGKWAAINMLMATGHPDDAKRAEALANQLRKNNSNYIGWHIHESWCKADPCDPANPESDNVSDTVIKHTELDVSLLHNSYSLGQQESFFSGATTSLARYQPQVAVNSYQRLAQNVLQRCGLPLRQGIFALLPHRLIINPSLARQLVARVISNDAEDLSAWLSLGEEAGVMKQFQLLLGFHHLSACEQLSVLRTLGYGCTLLLSLIKNIKPLEWHDLEKYFLKAFIEREMDELIIILLFHSKTGPFPIWLMTYLPQLLENTSDDVRRLTLRMLVKTDDLSALEYAATVLKVHQKQVSDQQEQWYYSELMYRVITQNIVNWEEVKGCLKFSHIAQLARIYGDVITDYAVDYFDTLLNKALQEVIPTDRLQLTLSLSSVNDRKYVLPSLNEIKMPVQAIDDDLMSLFKEDNIDDFRTQQQHIQERYTELRSQLSVKHLSELTHSFCYEDVATLVDAKPERALIWAEALLDDKNVDSLHLVRHIGLILAQALSGSYPSLSVQLFERLNNVTPFIDVVYTEAGIDSFSVAVWSASDTPELQALRRKRLYRVTNNDLLAKEVWAALFSHKEHILQQFIQDEYSLLWPVSKARSIMIAGYLNQNEISDSLLNEPGYSGFLQKTNNVAKETYQRHLWTLHWFSLMQQAQTAQEFWCNSVTFLQVVDERFFMLINDKDSGNDIFKQFWPVVTAQLSPRFNKPRRVRNEHLFGGKAPWEGFIKVKVVL